jgi:hypothetical protein
VRARQCSCMLQRATGSLRAIRSPRFARVPSPTGAAASVYEYGAGHFFTDVSLPDYSATATARAWTRSVTSSRDQ